MPLSPVDAVSASNVNMVTPVSVCWGHQETAERAVLVISQHDSHDDDTENADNDDHDPGSSDQLHSPLLHP